MSYVFAKLDPGLHRNPKVRKAGRLGREVFVFALCVNADRGATGRIPADYLEPWYLADVLQVTEAEAREGLAAAVAARLIELCPDMSGHLSGWDDDEWGRARGGSMTEAERKAQRRAKQARERAAERNQKVASCPDMSGHASGRPDQSESETESDTESETDIERAASPPPVKPTTEPADRQTGQLALVPGKEPRVHRKRSAHPMPAGFVPEPHHVGFARDNALDLDAEVEAFRLHHEAKGSVFASWSAALSTWLRNAVKFRRPGPQGGGRRGGATTAGSEVEDLLLDVPDEEFHPNDPRRSR